jgi:hypothetical protein
MTLKEKFENTMISFLIDRNQDKSMFDHFEKLTEEFAIEFAEWVMNNCDEFPRIDQKLILKIYKKEKGL